MLDCSTYAIEVWSVAFVGLVLGVAIGVVVGHIAWSESISFDQKVRIYCAKHTSSDWQYRVCVEGDGGE